MEFDKVIRERTAVRRFSSKKVNKSDIDKILEAGNLAPTAKNLQPHKIFIIESEEGLKKIDECSPCRYNAPVVILVCGDKNVAFKKSNYSTYEMDSCIVATHMMLETTNLGLGSIWVEMFDEKKIKELFNLDEDMEPICLLPIGYKDDEYTYSQNHLKRKDLDEIVKYC